MVGKNSRILKTGYTPPEEYTKMWKTILSGALWQGQFCNRKKNGELYWENASISPVSNPAGIVTHFVAVKEDITARKAAEDELFRSRQMLQLVLDNIPVQVFWKDRDLVYQGGNQVCAVEAGLHSPDEIIGKTDFDLSWKDLAQHYREDDQIILDTGMPKLNFEEPFPRPDGSQIWVRTKKVPLYSRDGKVIGVLGTSEDITERKQAEQEIAMANEKLISWVADLEQRNRDANLLRQMGDLLQVCNEHDAYYAIITKYIPQLFPSTSGALFITNDIHTSLEASTVWGEQLQSERTFAPDECWALRRGQIHKGMSSKSELNCQHIKKPLSGNYIDLPMLASGETIGVLHIESNYDDLFLENVQDLAHTLADHLSLSLSNLKLRETLRYQSTRDALTGLFNRRYMEESLARELPRAVRKNAPVGIIMLDIDHFKVFNDTYGHEAGDVVLREIGTLLRNQIRSEDIACRFGGEEFLLILPEANQEVTLQRAERIRAAVKAMRIDYCGQPLGLISVSLGVSVFPLHSAVAVGIIKKADEALYRAKNNGRDRVEVAPLS